MKKKKTKKKTKQNTTKKTKRKTTRVLPKRKSEVFSVSVRPEEIDEMNEFLDEMASDTGFRISRNEFVRRAALAHIRFSREYGKEYHEIFKTIG